MPRQTHPKLSPETRTSIERLLNRTRLTQIVIAARCGVSPSKVSLIARAIGFRPWARKSERGSHAQTTRNREIIDLVAVGRTYLEIAKQYGISRQRAHQIVRVYRDKVTSEE